MPLDSTPEPAIFTSERTGDELVIDASDLFEPPVQWGIKPRKSVTKYPGDATTVQMHGLERDTISLQGTIDDRWYGVEGHALDMRENMLALAADSGIVRLDYSGRQVWGIFSATILESDQTSMRYEIEFEVFWTDPPEYEQVMDFRSSPSEDATMTFTAIEAQHNTAREAPETVNDSIAAEMIEASAVGMAALSEIGERIGEVERYRDLAKRTIRQSLRQLKGAGSRIKSATERIASIASGDAGPAGVERSQGHFWAASTERRSKLSTAEIEKFRPKMAAALMPTSSGTYIVGRGDTLQSIAASELGEWSEWTRIADANDLDRGDIEVGDELKIPGGGE